MRIQSAESESQLIEGLIADLSTDELEVFRSIQNEIGGSPAVILRNPDCLLGFAKLIREFRAIGIVELIPADLALYGGVFGGINERALELIKQYFDVDVSQLITDIDNLVLSPERQDPRVSPMIAHLNENLEPYEPNFQGKGISGLLCGSLMFGDPSTSPDIDFSFVCADASDVSSDIRKISVEISDYVDYEIHCELIVVSELDRFIDGVDNGVWSAAQDVDRLDLPSFGEILSGRLIQLPGANSEKIEQALTNLRAKAANLIRRNPLFRAIVYRGLVQIFSDRHAKDRPAYRTSGEENGDEE